MTRTASCPSIASLHSVPRRLWRDAASRPRRPIRPAVRRSLDMRNDRDAATACPVTCADASALAAATDRTTLDLRQWVRRAYGQHERYSRDRLPSLRTRGSRRRHPEEASMFQVRIHGRGGQGVVSGAEMLSVAAFLEGRYAQAFPSFGSERMGAPVMAFCRIDDKEIRLREPVLAARRADHPGPDAAASGRPLRRPAAAAATSCINSTRSFDELGLGGLRARRRSTTGCARVPATELALKHVGRAGAERARCSAASPRSAGRSRLESVVAAIRAEISRQRSPRSNVAAATEAFALAQQAQGDRRMLKQTEGSHAVAEAVALCRPAGDLRLSDHAADAHRRGRWARW